MNACKEDVYERLIHGCHRVCTMFCLDRPTGDVRLFKQESIPVGCAPPAWPYKLQWPPDVSTGRGKGLPSEEVWTVLQVVHQMSLHEGRGWGGPSTVRSHIGGRGDGDPCTVRFHVWGQSPCTVRPHVSRGMSNRVVGPCTVRSNASFMGNGNQPLPHNRITDWRTTTIENITFLQIRWWG